MSDHAYDAAQEREFDATHGPCPVCWGKDPGCAECGGTGYTPLTEEEMLTPDRLYGVCQADFLAS